MSRFAEKTVRLDDKPVDLRSARAGEFLSLSDGQLKELAEDCKEARNYFGDPLGYVQARFTKELPSGRRALDFHFDGRPYLEPPGTPSVLAVVRPGYTDGGL